MRLCRKTQRGALLDRVSQLLSQGVLIGTELRRALLDDDRSHPMPTPVRRFLRYGDDLAEDYLNRVALLVMSTARGELMAAQSFGLPPYLDEVLSQVEKPKSLAAMSTAPRPTISFDPWASSSPELLLPATGEVDNWVLRDEFGQHSFRASTIRDCPQPLPVANRWVVEGRKGDELVNRMEVTSSVGGVYFFRLDDGQPITSERCTNDELVALAPPKSRLQVDGRALEDDYRYAPLAGEWAAYSVIHVDLGESSEVTVDYKDEEGKDKQDVVLFRGAAEQRAVLIGTPVHGVTGEADSPVFDGLPMLQIPRDHDPNRWFVRLAVNDQPPKSFSMGDLRRVEGGVGTGESVWMFDRPGEIPLVARIALRVSGPLGGDLDKRFVIVSGLNFRPPDDPVGPYDPVVCPILVDRRILLDGQRPSEIRFQPGDESLTVTAADRQSSASVRFKIPRLMWAIGDEVGTDGYDVKTVSRSAQRFLESKPTLWVSTGTSVDVRVTLRNSLDVVCQESDWISTSRRGGRSRLDLRRFSDTLRQSSDPLLCFRVETESGSCGDVIRVRRNYEVNRFDLRYTGGKIVVEFEEAVSMDSRVVRVWDVVRPWVKPVEFPISDGDDGSVPITFGTDRLAPSRYAAELTLERTERVFPGAASKTAAPFVIAQDEDPKDLSQAMAALADLPTRASITAAATDSDAMEIASRALLSIMTLVDPPPGLEIDGSLQRQIEHDAIDTLFDRPERLVEALIREHQSGRLGEHIAQLSTLQLVTSACDVPIDEGALSDLRYADLWEVSPVLAAAFDRPRNGSSLSRWKQYLGWVPSEVLPLPGGAFPENILQADVDTLLETHTHIVNRGVRLLGSSGFEEAVFRWLLNCNGDFSAVQEWRERHVTLLRLSQKPWPDEARKAYKQLNATNNSVLRLPADLLAISLHLVCFTNAERCDPIARVALSEAFKFAPRLVERQLAFALVHHLHSERLF